MYDTDGELLLDAMLRAYAKATGDDYAKYYTEEEYKTMIADNNAMVEGIGITARRMPFGRIALLSSAITRNTSWCYRGIISTV